MITIAGCGPGSEEHLTARARAAIESSDVVIGAPRLLELATRCPVRIEVTADIDAALANIERHHTGSTRVTVLVSGDPGIFSLAQSVIARFGREQCRIIPGISSVQAAFAAVGESWDDTLVLSAHHELPDQDSVLRAPVRKLALLSGRKDAQVWLGGLIRRLDGPVELYACENLSLHDERVTRITTDELANRTFASRCVFLVIGKE